MEQKDVVKQYTSEDIKRVKLEIIERLKELEEIIVAEHEKKEENSRKNILLNE